MTARGAGARHCPCHRTPDVVYQPLRLRAPLVDTGASAILIAPGQLASREGTGHMPVHAPAAGWRGGSRYLTRACAPGRQGRLGRNSRLIQYAPHRRDVRDESGHDGMQHRQVRTDHPGGSNAFAGQAPAAQRAFGHSPARANILTPLNGPQAGGGGGNGAAAGCSRRRLQTRGRHAGMFRIPVSGRGLYALL